MNAGNDYRASSVLLPLWADFDPGDWFPLCSSDFFLFNYSLSTLTPSRRVGFPFHFLIISTFPKHEKTLACLRNASQDLCVEAVSQWRLVQSHQAQQAQIELCFCCYPKWSFFQTLAYDFWSLPPLFFQYSTAVVYMQDANMSLITNTVAASETRLMPLLIQCYQ